MNNETLTPQELALYLGQEAETSEYKGFFSSVSTDGFAALDLGLMGPEWRFCAIEDVKLLLRPLSDITEQELIELAEIEGTGKRQELAENEEDYKRFRKNLTSASIDFWYVTGAYDTPEHERFPFSLYINSGGVADYMGICDNQHNVTKYLLSKGFDLFGFIESGKALDKTRSAALIERPV